MDNTGQPWGDRARASEVARVESESGILNIQSPKQSLYTVVQPDGRIMVNASKERMQTAVSSFLCSGRLLNKAEHASPLRPPNLAVVTIKHKRTVLP